ncbi:MAG: hypothetical protein JW881_21630 [Spirochaetales bacterium]|nr:hypothetical protein [Spirochaetales bacterium]
MSKKKLNYEISIQEEPGAGNVQLVVQINKNIEEKEFFILFSLIEEYNMILSIKDIIEAKYDILKKMSMKEIYYPREGMIACVTVIKDFDKTYINYLKYYFKNKLIYFIGKQDKELQKKAEIHLESIGFIISELVDNAFTYPFEKYLMQHPDLHNKLQNVPLDEKYRNVKKTDKRYHFNATIFFEAKLKNNNKELVIGISNEADISESTLEMINKKINDQLVIPEVFDESKYRNPYKETSGFGLTMVRSIIESINGSIVSFYDQDLGRFVVEFAIGLD